VLRRAAPVAGALACVGLIALGTLIDAPVVDGFSFPLTVGILAWSLASLRTLRGWLAVATLVGVALISRMLNEPDNAPINAVLLTVAIVGGATVGHSRAARAAAQVSASDRRQELQAAADEAVRAERQQIARDLHDLVSHAVSVIAVQAGAAELSWPVDPVAARRAVGVIRSTAKQTLAELDQALPGQGSVRHDLPELEALCDRMRAAGLSVSLELNGAPPPGTASTIYRVVQESLTNALRHAPGSRVLVRISTGAGQVRVEVADDGPGQSNGSRRGYGLEGLAERLRLAGGTFETHPGPNGFAVTAVLPSVPTPVRP
jgi:signal transduction histidine kinase